MIPTSAGKLALIQGSRYQTHWRLLIEDAAGVFRDYSDQGGIDWRETAEWGKTVDAAMADGLIEVRRQADGLSLSPMVAGSSLNTLNADGTGGYAPAIDMGRRLQVWVQDTEVGDPAVELDWVLVYDAIIQKVDASKPVMRLSTLDRSSLLHRHIRTELSYGDPAGVAVEDVIQDLIDDVLGVGVLTLAVPTSPGLMVTAYPKPGGTLVGMRVSEAIDQLTGAFGGYVDYRQDTLTLVVPDRTEPTALSAVATIGPEHYKAIPGLNLDLDWIRNFVEITFRNTATGEIETVQADHAGSIAAYGEQYLGITEAETSPIDTTLEAQAMADDILGDTAVQRVQQQVVNWFWHPVELGDHITWKANDDHYDTDQHWAVTGYRHRLSRDKRETTFDVRGAAIGGYKRWLRRAGGVRGAPTVEVTGLEFFVAQGLVDRPTFLDAVLKANSAAAAVRLTLTPAPDGTASVTWDEELDAGGETIVTMDSDPTDAFLGPPGFTRDGAEYDLQVTPYGGWDGAAATGLAGETVTRKVTAPGEIAAPTDTGHPATKAYVDAAVGGAGGLPSPTPGGLLRATAAGDAWEDLPAGTAGQYVRHDGSVYGASDLQASDLAGTVHSDRLSGAYTDINQVGTLLSLVIAGVLTVGGLLTASAGIAVPSGFSLDIADLTASNVVITDADGALATPAGGSPFEVMSLSAGGLPVWAAAPGSNFVDTPPGVGRWYRSTGNTSGDHGWSNWTLPAGGPAEAGLYLRSDGLDSFAIGVPLFADFTSDTLTVAQQHAQTAYLDAANVFTAPQTFTQILTASTVSGGVVFGGSAASGHMHRDGASGDLWITPQSTKNLDLRSGDLILANGISDIRWGATADTRIVGTAGSLVDIYVSSAVRWRVAPSGMTAFARIIGSGAPDLGNSTTGRFGVVYGSSLDLSGAATVGGSLTMPNSHIIGGFGAETTAGVLDWNDASNARSGNGHTLLVTTATNGPGGGGHAHPFSFEYVSKDGSGNLTQFAIPYGNMTASMSVRGRMSGVWSGWETFAYRSWVTNNFAALAGATFTGAVTFSGGVAGNFNILSGSLQTGGTTRLTNSGALQAISTLDMSGAATVGGIVDAAGGFVSAAYTQGAILYSIDGSSIAGLSDAGVTDDHYLGYNASGGVPQWKTFASSVVTSIIAGTAIAVSGATGDVTIDNDGVHEVLAPAGGGLTLGGTANSPSLTVDWSDGTLDSLGGVTAPAPSSGHILGFTTEWVNRTLAQAGIAAVGHNHDGLYSAIGHTHTADDIVQAAQGQVLSNDGSQGAYTGGGNTGDVLTRTASGVAAWADPSAGNVDTPPAVGRWYRASGNTSGDHGWSSWTMPALEGADGSFLTGASAGATQFRGLLTTDIPALAATKISAGSFNTGTYTFPGSLAVQAAFTYGASSGRSFTIGGTENGGVDTGKIFGWQWAVTGNNTGQDLTLTGLVQGAADTAVARWTRTGHLLIGTTTDSSYELDVAGEIRSTVSISDTSSDARWKDDLADLAFDRTALMAYRGRRWTWNELAPESIRGTLGRGAVAQELWGVAPDYVSTPVHDDDHWSIRYGMYLPDLILGFQDHETWRTDEIEPWKDEKDREIESLTKRLATAEARIAMLEAA